VSAEQVVCARLARVICRQIAGYLRERARPSRASPSVLARGSARIVRAEPSSEPRRRAQAGCAAHGQDRRLGLDFAA